MYMIYDICNYVIIYVYLWLCGCVAVCIFILGLQSMGIYKEFTVLCA